MKIAYNPLSSPALSTAPAGNDITFDLPGISIYSRGVRFKGTDTTYNVFKKHTSSGSGGYNGLVPVPSYTTTLVRYLREDGTWQIPTDLNTDVKVLQSVSTATTFRPLVLGLTESADINALTATVTGLTYLAAAIYAQPSTASLFARTFVGALKGNADTSTSLGNINVGNPALPVYFSAGKPIACTASSLFSNLTNNGNDVSVTIAGQNRLLTVRYASTAYKSTVLDCADIRETIPLPKNKPSFTVTSWFNLKDTPDTNWWGGITVKGWEGTYEAWEIAGPATSINSSRGFFLRSGAASTWNAWERILTSANTSLTTTTNDIIIKINNVTATLPTTGSSDGRYVRKIGDVMSGILTMNNTRIRMVGSTEIPTWNSPGAITWAESSVDVLAVSIVYTSYDSYRSPAGLKVMGSLGNEWFEAPRFIRTGSNDNYVLLGGGGHILKGNAIHNIPINNGTLNINLNADFLDNYHLSDILSSSIYNATLGILVTTDISANSDSMVTVKITGNSYGNRVINTILQFYNYQSGNYIGFSSATHFGFDFGGIQVFNYNNKVCFWFKQTASFLSYIITTRVTNSGIQYNRISNITNAAIPTTGVTRLITVTPSQGAYLDSNVASATKLLTPRNINGTLFDGTADITTNRWGYARTLSLTGSITGSATIDGSGNISLATTYQAGNIGNLDARYVNVAGDTMTGPLVISNVGLMLHTHTTSNYAPVIRWYLGNSPAPSGYDALIGWHNIGLGVGSITLLPYKTTTDPWSGTVGLYISKNILKIDGKDVLHSGNFPSYFGYIGTTKVQLTSANQALRGITSINNAFSFNLESDHSRIGFGLVHNVSFGEPGYAHRVYYFRPSYSATGFTNTSIIIQNASAADSPVWITTHSFDANGVAYHLSLVNASGFVKVGSSNSYVLTGGGSHNAFSSDPVGYSLVQRTSGGYVNATYFNSAIGDDNTTPLGSIYVRNTTDNYIRRMAYSSFISNIGTSLDSRYVTLVTDLIINGIKSFNVGKFRLANTESNTVEDISKVKVTGLGAAAGSAIERGFAFSHYATWWKIGNVRGDGADTVGFGIANEANVLAARISTGGIVANSFIKHGGTASLLLKANGTVLNFSWSSTAGSPFYVWGTALGNETTSVYATNLLSVASSKSFTHMQGTNVNGGWDANALVLTGGGISAQYSSHAYWNNAPSGLGYGAILTLGYNSQGSLRGQFAWDIDHNVDNGKNRLFFRTSNNLGWNATWDRILTDRTWASVVDGRYLPLTGGTLTGQLNTNSVIRTSNWFDNSASGIGLYNSAQDARWRAQNGRWEADKQIYSSSNFVAGNTALCTNLNADLLDGRHLSEIISPICYNYNSGILVTTDLPSNGDFMCFGKITGNSYGGSLPINTSIEFYNYTTSNAIIHHAGYHSGWNFGNINVFNLNGKICLWFSTSGVLYKTFKVSLHSGMEPTSIQHVVSLTNSTMPVTGVTRLVTIVPNRHAFITDNVASATRLQTPRTLWGQSFNGTANVDGRITVTTVTDPALRVDSAGINKAAYGWLSNMGTYVYNYPSAKYMGIKDDGTPHFHGSTLWHTGNLTGNQTAHSHDVIKNKPAYGFTSATLPNSLEMGVTAGFVNSNSGFGNYGTVLNVRTYSGGGGTLQIYTPYGLNNGGSRLKARFGNYDVSSGNSWTALKELAWATDMSEYLPLAGGTMTGLLTWNMGGITSSIGNRNNSFMHFTTNSALGFHFNREAHFTGNVYGGTNYQRRLAYVDEINNQVGGGKSAQMLWSSWNNSDVYGGAIQIREWNNVGNAQSAWLYAPALTFHWGNRHAKRFGLRSDGQFAIDDVPITLSSHNHNGTYVPLRISSNWSDNTVINNVVGLLGWKKYGNAHVIFDASNSTSPNGVAINSTNSQINWAAGYPTLMGWNGAATYGVRVDSARVADTTNIANVAKKLGRGGDANLPMVFNWSGQAGQPTYLWGGTDGTNMYVYNPSNFSVNYAITSGSTTSAQFLSTNYKGGVKSNPQDYFNNNTGVKVAMTGHLRQWSDTLWINGYNGSDVPYCTALHFARAAIPEMYISTQQITSTIYGNLVKVKTDANCDNSTTPWTCSALNTKNITNTRGNLISYDSALSEISIAPTSNYVSKITSYADRHEIIGNMGPIATFTRTSSSISGELYPGTLKVDGDTLCRKFTCASFSQSDYDKTKPRVAVVIYSGRIQFWDEAGRIPQLVDSFNPLGIQLGCTPSGSGVTLEARIRAVNERGLSIIFPNYNGNNTGVAAMGHIYPSNNAAYVSIVPVNTKEFLISLADDNTRNAGMVYITLTYWGPSNW